MHYFGCSTGTLRSDVVLANFANHVSAWPTLPPHKAGASKCSHVTEQGSPRRDSNTSKNPLTAELWGDSLLRSKGSRERDNIFAVLALEVIHSLQKGLSCVHTLWSKLMFVYRDCKAGEQECFPVLLVVSYIKGSFETTFWGVGGEVTCNSHIRRCLFPGKGLTPFAGSEWSFGCIFCFQCFHRERKINHEEYYSSVQSFSQLVSPIPKIKYTKPSTGSVAPNLFFCSLLLTLGGVWNFFGTCFQRKMTLQKSWIRKWW